MSTAVISPLAVWDVRDGGWWHQWRPKSDWARERGIPVDETYRIEFYVIDAPFARVFTYALNDQGQRYKDPVYSPEAATDPPFDVLLADLPPRELLESERP